MTANADLVELGTIIGTELGLLVKLARHRASTVGDVAETVRELPDEDIRALLLAAVFVLASGETL